MNLSTFITSRMEAILAEWETFADTLTPAATAMSPLALRDHARQILQAVALDLATPQTRQAQSEKSKGRAPVLIHAPETAAQTHAVLRAQSGFDINQLAAEYRALRASVLRLWIDSHPVAPDDLPDVIRFNEAIDQALAESIQFFSKQVNRARDLLLGMLGHDMRTPLSAVLMTANYLQMLDAGEEVTDAAASLIRCGTSIKELLDDLMDFNRTKLGLGINVSRTATDLAPLCADEVKMARAAHPDRRIELRVTGETKGEWDPGRVRQVLRNLVSNALKYGAADSPVTVTLAEDGDGIRIEVQNRGPAIEPATFDRLFDPLTRGASDESDPGAEGGMGLGLYIAREIARAHGGSIRLRSDAEETVFTVLLPRSNGH